MKKANKILGSIEMCLKVLQTIPWEQVDIEVISVELNHAGEVFPGTRTEIVHYMSRVGYDYVGTVGE